MRFEAEPIQPNRASEALLVAAPYLLLGGWLVAMLLGVGLPSDRADSTWLWARWGLRLVFVLTAVAVWQATQGSEPRPRWVYGWFGFAAYELIGVGLLGVAYLSSSSWLSGSAGLLVLPLGGLAFLPYFALALWLERNNREGAIFAVFPHAALTLPLFVAGVELWPPAGDSMLYWGVVALIALAGAVAAFVATTDRPSPIRLLYGGMALCQCATAIVIALSGAGVLAIIAAVILLMLGVTILSGPFILGGLLVWLLSPIYARWGQRLSPVLLSPALLSLLKRVLQIDAHVPTPAARITPEPENFETVHAPPISEELRAQVAPIQNFADNYQALTRGDQPMSETSEIKKLADDVAAPALPPRPTPPQRTSSPGFDRLFRLAVIVLALFAIGALLTAMGRSTIYKIHEYERGLHLRGGRFLAVQQPGWHFQIPLVDTVIIVKVNERLGYVERIPAMTSDNVTMIVSLQYTYKVTNPEQFALQVDDPERIVFEFVQGKLRDVVNTKAMADVMNNRVVMNDQVMAELKEKENQYGVQFVTVQMQSASPPDEVLTAIKDRMVANQRQEQAQAEAQQKKTQADADFYTSQKESEAEAYQITQTAEAEAERIRLTTEAQQLSIRSIIAELKDQGTLGEKYIDYLIAQQLKENSKWVISGDSTPILDLRDGGQ